MNPCHFCGAKGKRQCPAVQGMICPQCCGSKRGTEISCPAGCHYYPFSPSQYDAFLPIEASFDRKSLEYIIRRCGKDKWYETRERMIVSERDTEADDIVANGSAAYYLLFHEKNSSGRTLAEEWEKENCAGLNNDERIILKARKNSSATVIEIQKILDHQTMECIDLFDQTRPPFPVIDRRTAAAQMPRFTRILTWLDDYPYFSRLGAGVIIISDICRKLMKCPLLLANEMSPFKIGYSTHQNLDLGRLFDAVLYDRYGEGYENPRSYFKGRFETNPLD